MASTSARTGTASTGYSGCSSMNIMERKAGQIRGLVSLKTHLEGQEGLRVLLGVLMAHLEAYLALSAPLASKICHS